MRVLISGFAPFGGRTINPTALLIEALNNHEIPYPSELEVKGIILPVTFEDSYIELKKYVDSFNPDVVISFGQAGGRAAIELENLAVNKIKADIQDNAGKMPSEQLINPIGADSYFSTLPIQGLEGALKDAGLPVKVSNSAGLFVCNYLFYRLMEENQTTFRLCGFIHVPLLPEQATQNEPSLPLSDLKKALSVLLNYINY